MPVRATQAEVDFSAIGGIAPPPQFPLFSQPVPEGISKASSIGPAEERPMPKHRPVLECPQRRMIRLHSQVEESASREVEVDGQWVDRLKEELERVDALRQKELDEAAKETQSLSTWGTLSLVAQYVSSIGMMAFGFSVGGLAGALLIGAGVVGVTSRVIQDTGFLQNAIAWYTKSEELQKHIAHKIEMAMFFLQLGLGLAGGVLAWQSDVPTAAIVYGGQVVQVGARVGMSYHDKQLAHIRKKLKNLETEATTQRHAQSEEVQKMSRCVDDAQEVTEAVKAMNRTLNIDPE